MVRTADRTYQFTSLTEKSAPPLARDTRDDEMIYRNPFISTDFFYTFFMMDTKKIRDESFSMLILYTVHAYMYPGGGGGWSEGHWQLTSLQVRRGLYIGMG